MIASLAIALLAVPPAPVADGPEIVVRAVKRRCRVEVDARTLSNREFEVRAKQWVGKPVRVVAPSSADIKCLSKTAFRLAEQGVRLIHFVDPRDSAQP